MRRREVRTRTESIFAIVGVVEVTWESKWIEEIVLERRCLSWMGLDDVERNVDTGGDRRLLYLVS